MANTVTVLHNQSLMDIAIQQFGNVEAVVALAVLNDISITADLVAGQILSLEGIAVLDADIVNYYEIKAIKPATAIVDPFMYNTLFAEGLFANGLFK